MHLIDYHNPCPSIRQNHCLYITLVAYHDCHLLHSLPDVLVAYVFISQPHLSLLVPISLPNHTPQLFGRLLRCINARLNESRINIIDRSNIDNLCFFLEEIGVYDMKIMSSDQFCVFRQTFTPIGTYVTEGYKSCSYEETSHF